MATDWRVAWPVLQKAGLVTRGSVCLAARPSRHIACSDNPQNSVHDATHARILRLTVSLGDPLMIYQRPLPRHSTEWSGLAASMTTQPSQCEKRDYDATLLPALVGAGHGTCFAPVALSLWFAGFVLGLGPTSSCPRSANVSLRCSPGFTSLLRFTNLARGCPSKASTIFDTEYVDIPRPLLPILFCPASLFFLHRWVNRVEQMSYLF